MAGQADATGAAIPARHESAMILNVNDDEATRDGLSRSLRGAGYEVREASSGHEALALAREAPCLIILDTTLPDVDGSEVCRRLKADPHTAAIPVLQTSATDVPAAGRAVGLDSGADGYLVQPVEPTELVATVRALLRAQEAEAGLRHASTEWQRTFDAIAESAAILRTDGQVLRTNRALLGLMRAPDADVVGRGVRALFRERLGIDDPILDLSSASHPERRTSDVRSGDRWFRLVIDPIVDERGQPDRFVLVMTDITSLCDLADAERRRADELREDKHRKDEFLAMLAHELRNPLNAIAAAAALQQHVAVDDAYRSRIATTVSRQVRKLSRLVDDLLDVSRLTRGRVQLQKEATDLRTVLHDVEQMARPALDARHQPLRFDLPAEPVMVHGDSLRLAQAFACLLSNASKFSDVGRPILVRCEIDGQVDRPPVATVRVVDEGVGIEATHLTRIFEPFVQGETTLARSEGGLGVGLTIARRMVELHDGDITASSAGLGRGTEVRVTLPMVAVPPEAPHSAPALDGPLTRHGPSQRLDVLVIEDDEDAAELLRALLGAAGHRTRVARDGVTGLAEVLAHPPDVAFIDIGLPRMSGYDVARSIRQAEQGGEAWLVALTGYGRPEDRARALSAGFDIHLVKPLEIHRVMQLMAQRASRASTPQEPDKDEH
jgi:signal transduction histidine kinase